MPARVPQFDTDEFDLAEHVAHVRPGATIRGVFLRDLIGRAKAAGVEQELFALAEIAPRPYLPFSEYPLTDWVRIALSAARVLHRDVTWSEGLRRVGQSSVPAFMSTRVGAMIFDLVLPDVEAILLQAPKIYRVITTAGDVSVERVGHHHVQIFYEHFPGMIEHFQVGVVEGTMQHFRVNARIRVDLWSFDCGLLDVSW